MVDNHNDEDLYFTKNLKVEVTLYYMEHAAREFRRVFAIGDFVAKLITVN